MSYILDALKKAQAERQLGALPTIHALPIQNPAGGVGAKPWRNVLWVALGLLTLFGATLLVLMMRPSGQAAAIPAPLPNLPAPAPVAAVGAAVPALAPGPVVKAAPAPAPAPAPKKIPSTAELAPKTRTDPVAAPEESILTLAELPEPIQRQIPPIKMGGYIYSKNPADRLLLIDKVLRREGEELAPGLTLEKLQPKSAVFNFKGYRYRIAY